MKPADADPMAIVKAARRVVEWGNSDGAAAHVPALCDLAEQQAKDLAAWKALAVARGRLLEAVVHSHLTEDVEAAEAAVFELGYYSGTGERVPGS